MADTTIALILGFSILAIINLMLQLKLSQTISAHLRNGHSYSNIIEIRHLANRGLLAGVIACVFWTIIGWGAFTFLSLPSILKIVFAVGIFLLFAVNLLIPIHCEERISLPY